MAAVPRPEVPQWFPSPPSVPAGHPAADDVDASFPAGSLPSPSAAAPSSRRLRCPPVESPSIVAPTVQTLLTLYRCRNECYKEVYLMIYILGFPVHT